MSYLSIVIPTYNGAHLLQECLASLKQQEYLDFNVIVVDNNSSDNTENIIRKYSELTKLVKLRENSGFAKAVNVGIRTSDADFIIVMNNDIILAPDCIRHLVDAAKHYHHASFAPLVYQYEHHSLVDSAGLMFSDRGYGNRSNRFTIPHEGCPLEIFCPCGSIALYKRTVLDKVGLFNEQFFMFFEDLELGFRLQLQGYKSILIPQANAFHRGGATAKLFDNIRVEQSLSNALATLITCVPTDWLVRDSFRIIHFYSLLHWFCVKYGYLPEVLKAISKTIYKLPYLLVKRSYFQRKSSFNSSYLRSLLYSGDIELNLPSVTINIPNRFQRRRQSVIKSKKD